MVGILLVMLVSRCNDHAAPHDNNNVDDAWRDATVDAMPHDAVAPDAMVDDTPDAWVWASEPCDATFVEITRSQSASNESMDNWDRFIVYGDVLGSGSSLNREVFLYDLVTCTDYRLTHAPRTQALPKIWELEVIWFDEQDRDDQWDGVNELFDVSSATFHTLEGMGYGIGAFNERYMVTFSQEGEDFYFQAHPVFWDRQTGEGTVLAEPWEDAQYFSISETHLVWVATCVDCVDLTNVFYLDLATQEIVQIPGTTTGEQRFPTTWGDYVLWQESSNIRVHQISTGETRELIPGEYFARGDPHLRGNLLMYGTCRYTSDCTYIGGDIVLFDMETDVYRRVTPESGYFRPEYAHGDWLVYRRSSGDYAIYALNTKIAGLVDAEGHVIPE